jgi:hypothetical protein
VSTVQLDAVEAALFESHRNGCEGIDEPLDVARRHDVGHRPAQRVGLIRYAHGRSGRVPKLLTTRMPELADQTRARTLDGDGGAPECFEIDIVIARDDRAVGKRLRIDGDDFAHDESGAAPGARQEKVDPALGDAVPGAVVCQRRWKRDAIADFTGADPNGGE